MEPQLSLPSSDPHVHSIIQAEENRQRCGLELIASENFTSRAVMDAMGSCLTNKYSEGYPGARDYPSNEEIDNLERLCQQRALKLFKLSSSHWSVNVQPYGGSVANFIVMTALLKPGDRIMGLSGHDGGHVSHGLYEGHETINVSSRYFSSLPYHIDYTTGLVDYEELAKMAERFCPKLIIGGGSTYPRDWEYCRLREIADSVDAILLIDTSHYTGLVAAGILNNPFVYADIVTTTTHKTLRGPRQGMIFSRKEFSQAIDAAVYPGLQGGPHNHVIAGVCVALGEAMKPNFVDYSNQVVKNAKRICKYLKDRNHKIVTGGTDTHQLLWDLRSCTISGTQLEALCDVAHISLNGVHGDLDGVRIGTPALTSRGMMEREMDIVGEFLLRAFDLAVEISRNLDGSALEFVVAVKKNGQVAQLGRQVQQFAGSFGIPGRSSSKL